MKSEYRAKLKNISDLQYCVLWSAIDVAAQGRCSGIEVAIVISHLVYKRMEFRKEYGYFSISIYWSVSRHLHLLHVYITLPYVLLNSCFLWKCVNYIRSTPNFDGNLLFFLHKPSLLTYYISFPIWMDIPRIDLSEFQVSKYNLNSINCENMWYLPSARALCFELSSGWPTAIQVSGWRVCFYRASTKKVKNQIKRSPLIKFDQVQHNFAIF